MRILLLRRRTITNHRNRRWGLEWGFYSDFNSWNSQCGLLKHISSNIKAHQQTKTFPISAYPAFKTKDWTNTCRMKLNQKVTPLMNRGYNNLSLTGGVYRKSWVIYLRSKSRLWKLNLLTIPNNVIIMIHNYMLISKLLVRVRYRICLRGNIVSLRHKKYSLATNKTWGHWSDDRLNPSQTSIIINSNSRDSTRHLAQYKRTISWQILMLGNEKMRRLNKCKGKLKFL